MCFFRSSFRIFRAAGTLLIGLILASGAGATDFPVSTVAQITTALASALPGDTITMTNKVWTDADILFKKSGTAGSPITLRAQTPGQVILNGVSRLRIAGNWLVVDGLRFQSGFVPDANTEIIAFRDGPSSLATNCALINCAIIDYRGTWSNDCKWVSVYGRSNRVENCYFAGKTNLGTTLVVWLPATNATYANYHVIRRNYFGLRPALGVNGGETIRVGTSTESLTSSRTLVEENFFQSCNGEIEIISNKSCDNLYRHNTFDSCEGTLTLRHGNRCTVEGNWFFGHGLPDTGGVRIIGEDHTVFNNYFDGLTGSDARSALSMMDGIVDSPLSGYFQVKRAKVLFNTFVNCTNNFAIGVVGTGTSLPPIDSTNANNTVYGSTAPLVDIQTEPVNFLWEGNYFSGATVGITNSGIATNDPLMVLNSDGLWRPATNSPVLGAAAGSYTFVTNDFDGQPRIGAKDVGCDQVSASAQTYGPLGPTDVGPDWIHITLSGGSSNQMAAVGSNVSFSVVTEGTPPFFYRWQKNGTNLVDGGKVSGATTDTLTLTGILLSDAADYRVVVTNTMYSVVTSTVAALTIDPATVTNDVSVASTNVFLDDQWVDGTRTDTSFPADSAWYASSALSLTAETNRLVGLPSATSTLNWWTYLTSNSASCVQLGASDTLRVTLAFTPYGVNAGTTSRGLRIGLFNSSDGTRTVVDGANPNGTNHAGYILDMNFGEIFGGTTMKFQERTNLTSSTLINTATDTYAELSSGGPAAGSGGFSNGVPYTLQLLVKRNINSVDLTATFSCTNGGWSSLSFSGTDTNNFTSAFDTFVFRPGTNAVTATNFTFTEFKVELVAVDNQPPAAGSFATNTAMNQAINIPAASLLAAATDADGDTLSITAVSALSAKTGTVTLIGGNITYTPPGGYAGDDQFSYTLTDYRGADSTGYVSVTIVGSTYTLTTGAGANGTVSPASTNVLAGGSATFVIMASNYYRIVALTTNGTAVTGTTFDNNSTATNFIWSNVQTDGVLVATFTSQVANDPAGTPYEWLAGYGLTNYNTDDVADQDSDGLTAWQEYITGTDPTNTASCFKATQSVRDTIIWNAVSGRAYSVYWTTNLMNSFQLLEANILYPQSSYTNTTPSAVLNYYQIKVRLQ